MLKVQEDDLQLRDADLSVTSGVASCESVIWYPESFTSTGPEDLSARSPAIPVTSFTIGISLSPTGNRSLRTGTVPMMRSLVGPLANAPRRKPHDVTSRRVTAEKRSNPGRFR